MGRCAWAKARTMIEQLETSHLTARERDVLAEVCIGRSSKEIALRLGIRPQTVEAYVARMRLKLGATNRCHLVALAVHQGLCLEHDEAIDGSVSRYRH
ncbi:response regulator transcription factor [Stakelama saccharophila]|uniref:Helix-turn-helix transcriptional regulator n=1 Tax=Stakelama saccharophila TaxID=3075605 RepID=A0ABZ0BBB5_9SPHN|nr:helix-turn-helix transcriptional regulator [Stakelama sp. W311]WNO54643.1 helix-turn-helix transcriptional regulator [Stakelama sp. W311]